ncbi:MAG: glycosyltransferase family 39 protein, partial [Calditrichota bacterium]
MFKFGPLSKEVILLEIILPAFCIIFFGYLLLLSFANGFNGMSYDEAYWTYVGQHWLSGTHLPYLDVADNKPPAIHLLFGFSAHLVGPAEYLPRILGSLAIALTGFLVYRIATVLHNYKAGLIAFIMFALSITWKDSGWRFTAQTESFVILCSTAAVYLLLKIIFDLNTVSRWRLLCIGAILGLGLLFKQTAIFGAIAVFVLLFIYSREKYVPSALWIASGILGVVLSILLIPVIQGVPPELILKHLFSAPVTDSILPEQSRLSMFKAFVRRSGRIILFLFGIAFLIQNRRSLKSQRLFIFLLIWVALEIFALSVPGNYATYQLRAMLPALAVTFGIGFMANWKGGLQAPFLLGSLVLSCQIHPEVINTV